MNQVTRRSPNKQSCKKAQTLHVQAEPSPLFAILKEGEENILELGG